MSKKLKTNKKGEYVSSVFDDFISKFQSLTGDLDRSTLTIRDMAGAYALSVNSLKYQEGVELITRFHITGEDVGVSMHASNEEGVFWVLDTNCRSLHVSVSVGTKTKLNIGDVNISPALYEKITSQSTYICDGILTAIAVRLYNEWVDSCEKLEVTLKNVNNIDDLIKEAKEEETNGDNNSVGKDDPIFDAGDSGKYKN